MVTLRDVNTRLDELTILRLLVESYQEIAASRMRRTRTTVLTSRRFQLGLEKVFAHLKASYQKKIERLVGRGKAGALRALLGKEKTVHVFLSANTGFYGGLIANTYRVFKDGLQRERGEAVIVGKRGWGLYRQEKGKAFAYFDFPDDTIDPVLFENVAVYLSTFDKIFVYFGRFENIIIQQPSVLSISGDVLLKKAPQQDGAGSASRRSEPEAYIFEPSIEKLMAFFKKEIFTSLFEQTILESQLAKSASRMVSLDSALDNLEREIKETRFAKVRAIHREQNRKQTSLLSGMSLWT